MDTHDNNLKFIKKYNCRSPVYLKGQNHAKLGSTETKTGDMSR